MSIQHFKKNSEVCIGSIKVITISKIGYYSSVEKALLDKVLKIISSEKKKSYKLINYNIFKIRDFPNTQTQEYIAQILLTL